MQTGDGTHQQAATELQLQGRARESSPATSATGLQQPFKAVRIFGWQEKVYSKSELVAAQVCAQLHPPAAATSDVLSADKR